MQVLRDIIVMFLLKTAIHPGANYQIVGSVPNRPVRPTLGPAGPTQAFSETAGPDCGKPGFQKRKPGPAWVTCRPQVINPGLQTQRAISMIDTKVRVDTRDFQCFNI